MKTLYVHPAVMKRLQQGNMQPIITRYELSPGDEVEITDDDEVVSIHTKIRSVQSKNSSLFLVEIDDPATAFRKEDSNEQ